ncbi:molybdopterin-synthase adenylyltransferase MoeB [Methyloversatilis sp. XJ19-13]|uniref:HesA/MoeB/ThiF family protein n=1 Tax=Methyloversatilis sp. XJ19-13 TaxID=2963430 RepID=UPI00211C7424|nr:molybdopterin-synthase adenylyltransferase MoeB [Methyloversatilis sp. XJ19-13]MCQ9373830.1 molybdopterin-synthase adenylyltransferase MoeB [Methyloversatilis sp. XJ19-13]
MNDEQLLRYSRHILLDPIGIEGQDRLLASRALIVGAGGLGCPAALYMAAAGVGTLVIVDDDEVDLTNLQRQVLHRQHSVGRAKVESAREALHDINPGIEVIALKTRLAGDALREQVEAADVVLDCSDNFATRHAINRACVAARTPLVSGAAIRFDGQVSVFDSRNVDAPCYHCLFPEGGDADEVRCAVMGVFAPLTGIIGSMQAAEALKLLAHTGQSLAGRLLLLDALGMEWRSITLPRDPACEVCGPRT